ASDLRYPDDAAGLVADRRDGQRDVEPPAVFREPYGLEVLDASPGPDSREDLVLLGVPLRRNQHVDRPPYELLRGVAEDPLAALVARADHSVQVLRDDRVGRRLD